LITGDLTEYVEVLRVLAVCEAAPDQRLASEIFAYVFELSLPATEKAGLKKFFQF
jgi:hypothetical protein